MLNMFHSSCIIQQETVATFANASICFPPLPPPPSAESETTHRKQVAPGKGDGPAGWKRGTETEVMFGHPRLKREGMIMDATLLSAFVPLCRCFGGCKLNLSLFSSAGSVSAVQWERNRFGDRVFWVRSTQATCASAAGAGPAVPKSEDFSMDTGSPDPSNNEVKKKKLPVIRFSKKAL